MRKYAKHENLSVSIFQYPYSPFRFIGRLQLNFALITALGYFFAAAMTVLYWGVQLATIFWYFLGIAFVIGFFILPQWGFHKKLREKKLEALKMISKEMQKLYEQTIDETESNKLQKLKEKHELADLISKLPEWPFDLKAFLSVIMTIIIPILLMVLQTLIKFLFGDKN